MKRTIIIFIFSIGFSSGLLSGKDSEELMKIQRIHENINFDGLCDEITWDKLDPLSVGMFRPNHGSAPTEKSEIFVTFNDEFFYMGARLHYSSRDGITVTTKKRDGADGGSDNFGILLDTFNDNENGICFETNPSGLRSDFSIANDAVVNPGTRPFNRSWNAFWDVKTTIIDNIWHVEMKIPLSSLRFQEEDGQVIMGMSIWRIISKKQEWSIFPLITNDFGSFGVWKPSQAKKVVFKGISRKNAVYLTPYALAGFEQTSEISQNGTDYQINNDRNLNAGLDIKYGLTSNITMDLTFNTDFAQVEADDQMVNLTRFSLFFPEKRQFFLERSSIFTIKTGYLDQLFYSRRIGLHEGEIVPIIAGARVVGRAGEWDLGFMDMQTSAIEYIDEDTDSVMQLESTNHGVFRIRKQVINTTSYAGGMVTSKIDVKGNYNINTALDLIYNPFQNDYITVNYAQTFDSDTPMGKQVLDHGKFYFNWQNRSTIGFNYDFMLSRAGENYNPEMGFELMEDYSRLFGQVGYGWVYNDEKKKILSQQLTLWSWLNKRNVNLVTDISNTSLMYSIRMKKGMRGSLNLLHNYENINEPFELSDDVIFPIGKYSYTNLEGRISTPSNRLIALRTRFTLGTYYDGTIATIGPVDVTFRPSSSFKLGLDYQYSWINVDARKQYFKAHLARLKTELTFTTKLSLLAFFQYSSNDKFGINNIRFRYNPREGNDLYLVYNGEYNTHLTREYPSLPRMDRNTFILKYTYTFIWDK
ncbi:DUF5916 domain-containing protein [Bacteroidota bacterium]